MDSELNIYLEKLTETIYQLFAIDNSGHDFYHLIRVKNLALHIQEKEGGDRIVIGIAALLHDVHRLMEIEKGEFIPPKDSLPKVKEILEKILLPIDKIEKILHCIEYHEEYNFSKFGKTVNDIETLILQDADNLDAIGAIGVGRTFTFGGAHNIPMWLPEKSFDRNIFDESEKDLSTLHHFHSKLLRLKSNMNTETGKIIAEARHKFMEQFVDQFILEWKGNR